LERICSDEYDDESIKGFLSAMEIRPFKDCINKCYDNAGAIYEIPNYCINDPVDFKVVNNKVYKDRPPERNIQFKAKNFNTFIDIECKNTITVRELKMLVFTTGKFAIKSAESLRMFYSGKELQNVEEVWFYSIDNNSIIQVMYNQ
jgi:hypothetical protein